MTDLRAARPGDAPALAQLHVTVWREIYGTLAPEAACSALDEARRLRQWQGRLKAPPPTGVILAEGPAGLAGFVAFGPGGAPLFEGTGEIQHLYVAPAHRGTGLGRRLLAAGLAALAEAGHLRVGLAVVAENGAARAFYRRAGGQEGEAFLDPGPLWRSSNIAVWFALSPPKEE